MGHTENRDVIRTNLDRLLAGLEFFRNWRIAAIRQAKGHVTQADLNEIVIPSSEFLQLFDNAKGRAANTVLTEVQRWYAHTASDLAHVAQLNDQAQIEVAQFLNDFRKALGFDFLAEAGLLRKIATKAFKQNQITNRMDYEALKEIEIDLSQKMFSEIEISKIAALLRRYELK